MAEEHRSIKQVFRELSTMGRDEAFAALDRLTLDDESRRELWQLLGLHFDASSTRIDLGLDGGGPPLDELEIGEELGRYRILREVGRGGMSVVYEAEDTLLDRRVALKVVASGSETESSDLGIEEGRALASFNNPRIAAVYDVIQTERVVAIAMPLLTGGTLAERLSGPEGLSADERRWLLAEVGEVARALDDVHQADQLHLDIKPQNIVFDHKDRAVLTDFGAGSSLGSTPSTRMGTPGFVAPERLGDSACTAATDVYSFGGVLRAVCGLPIARPQPVDVPGFGRTLTRDLSTIIAKCLEDDPLRRYQNSASLGLDLRDALEGNPIVARPPSLARRAWRFAKRRQTIATAAVLVVVFALAVLGVFDASRAKVRVVTDEGSPAMVSVLEADGTLRTVGAAPTRFPVSPDERTRVVVRREGATAEFWVTATAWETTEVRVPLQPDEEVVRGMVALPAVAGFGRRVYLDPREVSNAEYEGFLEATGRGRPAHWPEGSLPGDWQDLPVVGVTFDEAESYALWAGKRLPTQDELDRAWAEIGPQPAIVETSGRLWRSVADADAVAEYVEALTAIYATGQSDGEPEDRRVRFVDGGVAEMVVDAAGSVGPTGTQLDIVMGRAWYEFTADAETNSMLPRKLLVPGDRRVEVAFRCAKTIFVDNGH